MIDKIILVVLAIFIVVMICSIIKLIIKIKTFQIEDADSPMYADSNHTARSKPSSKKGKSFFGWTDLEEEEEEEQAKPSKTRRGNQSQPANRRSETHPKRQSVDHSSKQVPSRPYERVRQETSVSQFLLCLPESRQTIPLKEGKQYVCGRSDECDLVFSLPFISRQHCLLEVEDGNLFLYDKQSTNGVEVNGARIRRAIQLNSGDTVGVKQHILFRILIKPASRC